MTLPTPEEVAHKQPAYIVALEEHKETAIAQCLIITDAIRADRNEITKELGEIYLACNDKRVQEIQVMIADLAIKLEGVKK